MVAYIRVRKDLSGPVAALYGVPWCLHRSSFNFLTRSLEESYGEILPVLWLHCKVFLGVSTGVPLVSLVRVIYRLPLITAGKGRAGTK